jgi:hypothetical protein
MYVTVDSGNLFRRDPFTKNGSLIDETYNVDLDPNSQAVAARALYEFAHHPILAGRNKKGSRNLNPFMSRYFF